MQENNKKLLLQKRLAAVIKQHRQQLNKSISLISNEIAFPKSMWSDTEKGIKDPQLSTLWKIAEALGVSLSELIKEVEEQNEEDFSLID